MIEVKLEKFEDFRANLIRYAYGLLRNRAKGNTKDEELLEDAKDIVQETYLSFHKHHKDPFVSDSHLESFVKTCLYMNYRHWVTSNILTVPQSERYKILRVDESGYNWLSEAQTPKVEPKEIEEFVTNPEFRSKLTEKQKFILDKLYLGYGATEISKELGITRQAVQASTNHIKDKLIKHGV